MKMPMRKPAAMHAMDVNRSNERHTKQFADLLDLSRATAERVAELTGLVADLQERVAQMEGEGRG